jgi:hypothetical protein
MGSAETRRKRKQWLLDTFGNGQVAFCGFPGCKALLTFTSLTVDRYPDVGGSYRRGNIRPACATCQNRQGNAIMRAIVAARRKTARKVKVS